MLTNIDYKYATVGTIILRVSKDEKMWDLNHAYRQLQEITTQVKTSASVTTAACKKASLETGTLGIEIFQNDKKCYFVGDSMPVWYGDGVQMLKLFQFFKVRNVAVSAVQFIENDFAAKYFRIDSDNMASSDVVHDQPLGEMRDEPNAMEVEIQREQFTSSENTQSVSIPPGVSVSFFCTQYVVFVFLYWCTSLSSI